MRIGVFDPYLDTVSGGEKYMLSIASFLSKSHQVDIFWDPKEATNIAHKAQEKFNLDLEKTHIVENVFTTTTSLFKRISVSRKYDTIFYLSDGSIPFIFPKKLIVHFQFPVEKAHNGISTKIKLLRVSNIICNSFFTKKYIDKKFLVDSTVVYPPVDTNNSKIDFSEKENSILTVGRYEELLNKTTFKKQEFLIEQFKKLSKTGLKNWKFYIVTSSTKGDHGYGELKSSAKGFPIEVLNNISKEELSTLYKKTKIYWHAAGFGEDLNKYPEHAEHFGISTVESMSYGTVPVVFGAGGQAEIVKNETDGFLWTTESQLLDKTLQVARDSVLRQELAKNALTKSKKFTTKVFCENIQKIIE